MQRAGGLYGSLIVDLPEGVKEPFHYDSELNLLLSDWWHRSVQDQMTGLSARPFRWIDEPQVSLSHRSSFQHPGLHRDILNISIMCMDADFANQR